MAYSETQLIARISTVLQDTGTARWGTAEIRQGIDDALREVAEYRPNVGLATVTTSAGTKDFDISSVSNLLHGYDEASFEAVEFQVNKDPRRFRNFKIHGSRLTMDISFEPAASESVRLYVRQPHVVVSGTATATNTLDPTLERLLIDMVAAKLAISKSSTYVGKVTVGGGRTFGEMKLWGNEKLALTYRSLARLKKPDIQEEWPKVV